MRAMNLLGSEKDKSPVGKTWGEARNILCVRLDNFGDVLMTTPAIRALKAFMPGRRITLLASNAGANIARFIPEVDDVIEYQPPWMKSTQAGEAAIDHAMIRTLRRRRFDAAVIFTVYSQSPLPAALFCHLAEIPLRLAHCRENPYCLLTDWVPDPEPEKEVRHEVRRQLDLVAAIGCRTKDERLSFDVHADSLTWARRRLSMAGVDLKRPWILIHPGASAASRRYPPELWAPVAQQLGVALGCPIVFTGNADEIPLVESIRQTMTASSYSLAGTLTIDQLAAVVSLSPLLLCGNTGPAHLAAALGTPVVDLYALTNPQHTPWQVPSRVLFHDVPCRFCYKSICPEKHQNCLRLVSPAQVVAAALELLSEKGESRLADSGGQSDTVLADRAVVPGWTVKPLDIAGLENGYGENLQRQRFPQRFP